MYNIGITVIASQTGDFFTNGIKQNCIILRELLEKCKNVKKAYLINIQNKPIEENSAWYEYKDHILPLVEVSKENMDLVIHAQGYLDFEKTNDLHSKGIKSCFLCMGNELAGFDVRIITGDKNNGTYKRNPHVKTVWITPQFYHTNKDFLSIIHGSQVLEAPFIWDPRFVEKKLENMEVKRYKPRSEKRISVFEPNLSYVKTSTVPMIIIEKLERKYPHLFSHSYIFNGAKLSSCPSFVEFVRDLDVYKNKKMSFEARYDIVYCLLKHTDIVISHQYMNALNYLYCDALWLGFPLLHNSDFIKDIGWYFPDNNAELAVEHLHDILTKFDFNYEKHREEGRKYCERFFINNPDNIKRYEMLIEKSISG